MFIDLDTFEEYSSSILKYLSLSMGLSDVFSLLGVWNFLEKYHRGEYSSYNILSGSTRYQLTCYSMLITWLG